jgi:hypothetical protein
MQRIQLRVCHAACDLAGVTHHFNNQKTTIKQDVFGVTITYAPTPNLIRLLSDEENMNILREKRPQLDDFWHQYRVHQQWKRKQEETALSSAFVVFVYDAPYMCMSALMDYFEVVETNAALRQVIHAPPLLAELKLLVFNTVFLGANQALSFWFVVFEDVWYCNHKLRALKTPAARLLLDTCTPSTTAIRVRPLSREELIERLQNAKAKRLFPQGLLDCIYHKMDELFYATPEGA